MHRFLLVLLIVVAVGLAGAQSTKSKTVNLAVSGMHCDNCVAKVDKALRGVEGVKNVKVDLKSQTAEVVLASASVKSETLIKAVSDAGFQAAVGKNAPKAKKDDKGSCCSDKDSKIQKEGATKQGDCCKDKEGKMQKEGATQQEDCCKDKKKTDGKN